MIILLNNHGYDNQQWQQAISQLLPKAQVVAMSAIESGKVARDAVDYALVWNHPLGDLINYPNLKAIQLLGAGTEHIDCETALPDIPIMRLCDPAVAKDMAQYCLLWALLFYRKINTYPSLKVLQKRAMDVTKLVMPYEPDDVVTALAHHKAANPDFGITNLHLFPLGGIDKSAEYAGGGGSARVAATA